MVWRIAQRILQDQAFESLPVLADALLDAGCDNEDVLSHCRSPGPHVPQCWVLNFLLEPPGSRLLPAISEEHRL